MAENDEVKYMLNEFMRSTDQKFSEFNKRTDEKFNDREKKNDERHDAYKEERKEIKEMLSEINKSIKELSEKHTETEKNVSLILSWSVDAKNIIEANSKSISLLQKRDYMVMGAVAVLMTTGSILATLFIKDIVQNEIEKNNQKIEKAIKEASMTSERVTQATIDALDKKASQVEYEKNK